MSKAQENQDKFTTIVGEKVDSNSPTGKIIHDIITDINKGFLSLLEFRAQDYTDKCSDNHALLANALCNASTGLLRTLWGVAAAMGTNNADMEVQLDFQQKMAEHLIADLQNDIATIPEKKKQIRHARQMSKKFGEQLRQILEKTFNDGEESPDIHSEPTKH